MYFSEINVINEVVLSLRGETTYIQQETESSTPIQQEIEEEKKHERDQRLVEIDPKRSAIAQLRQQLRREEKSKIKVASVDKSVQNTDTVKTEKVKIQSKPARRISSSQRLANSNGNNDINRAELFLDLARGLGINDKMAIKAFAYTDKGVKVVRDVDQEILNFLNNKEFWLSFISNRSPDIFERLIMLSINFVESPNSDRSRSNKDCIGAAQLAEETQTRYGLVKNKAVDQALAYDHSLSTGLKHYLDDVETLHASVGKKAYVFAHATYNGSIFWKFLKSNFGVFF